MSPTRPSLVVARAAALLALGALAVHELRYLIASGGAGGEALHRESHAYLAEALPVIVALASATLAAILLRGAMGWTAPAGSARSRRARWLRYAGALLIVFCAQELTEGALASGHPAGLDALVGDGAWIAGPLALLFGAVAAIAERLLSRTERALAAATMPLRALRRRPPRRRRPLPRVAQTPLAASPLAFGLARRPPPVSSLV